MDIPGQLDIYECIEIASLDAMLAAGYDIAKDEYRRDKNFLVPDEDDE